MFYSMISVAVWVKKKKNNFNITRGLLSKIPVKGLIVHSNLKKYCIWADVVSDMSVSKGIFLFRESNHSY